MPIIKKNNLICHFAHISKCGGTSIELYLKDIGASIAFLDPNFLENSKQQTWNISSPQHIDGNSLSKLFPANFFDFSFTVVRNPIDRFKSAFKFQMYIEKKISIETNINNFISKELKNISLKIGIFDNHFLPQTKFLYPSIGYKIFALENGLFRVKEYIDKKFSQENKNIKIGSENKSKLPEDLDKKIDINEVSIEILNEIYREDFKLFNFAKNL